MGLPPLAVPKNKLDQEVIDHLRNRIRQREKNGYTTVSIQTPWMEQLLAIAEKGFPK